MRKLILSLWLALAPALLAAPAAAQTEAEQRQLDWAQERGRLIFALDRVAWVATDDLRGRVPDPVAAGVRGYIVDRDATGFIPIFFGEEDGRPVAIYRARVTGPRGVSDAMLFAPGERPPLTARQVRLVQALNRVRQGRVARCTAAAPNVSIIPPAGDDDPIDVYVTAPQMRQGHVQFGGHERISIGPHGQEIARRPFTRSCLEVPLPPEQARRQGAMLGVRHLLDPVPTEIHVFLAMAARAPIAVIAGDPARTWQVTGESIALLQQGAPQRN
jgi:hypothetical protein